jgi:nicotinic acid mononucleotide adenylyltransferase
MSTKAIFTFGRFNPPTRAHQHIIEWGANRAHINDADYFLFPSPSVDKEPKQSKKDPLKSKNPIPFPTKVAILRRLFPTINIVEDPSVYSPQQVIAYLSSRGYTDVTFVVGSDRVEAFNARWLPYALDELETAQVISAAERQYEAHGVESMSASKARAQAIEGDFDSFVKATGWERKITLEIYAEVRNGMGISGKSKSRPTEQPV